MPELLTKIEVARLLKVCLATVTRMVRRGQLPPPVRYSKKMVRFRSRDIENWLTGRDDRAAVSEAD